MEDRAVAEGFFERWSRRKQQVREQETSQDVPSDHGSAESANSANSESSPKARNPAESATTVSSAASLKAEAPPPRSGNADESNLPPAPSLADTESLTIDSDFKPFMARNVAPEVKNAAFKKLFADPHFNVMDGLDTYIDDYSIPSPLPPSMLRRMASAQFLKLVDDEPEQREDHDVETNRESQERQESHEKRERVENPEKPSIAAAEVDMAQSSSDRSEPDLPEGADAIQGVSPPSPQVAFVPPASQDFDDNDPDLRLQPDHAARAPDPRGRAG
ncbi:conserved hypothetical protein [Burkholderiales bacterium 8X]|nr:conserved hypothetical protein [Burkholderiales bacterium 8X]